MGAQPSWPSDQLSERIDRLLERLGELVVLLQQESEALMESSGGKLHDLACRTRVLLQECQAEQQHIQPYLPMLSEGPLREKWQEVRSCAQAAARLNELNSLLLALPRAHDEHEGADQQDSSASASNEPISDLFIQRHSPYRH